MTQCSLGSILLENGLISQIQLDEALKQQKQQVEMVGWQLLGEILVASGRITRHDLESALDRQAKLIEIEFFGLRAPLAASSRCKRTLDVLGALVGLGITTILLPLIAIALYLESPGRIFVVQPRVGLRGKQFRLWRFRTTMPAVGLSSLPLNPNPGEKFFHQQEQRPVTWTGRLLRRFYLDELPQFWNVLRGEMSLVGSRPPTPDEVKFYEAKDWQRLAIKPGMTGLWQIHPKKYDLDFEQILNLDFAYIHRWRIESDLKILFSTVVHIIGGLTLNQTKAMRLAGERNKVSILNLPIDNLSIRELLEQLNSGVVLTPNVDHLMKLQKDVDFYRIYAWADYKVCDSQVLMYASHFLGTPLKEKISGSDLFPIFCDYHRNNPEITIFIMGGAPGVADRARTRLNHRAGRELVIGSHSPSFGFEKNESECLEIVELINQSKATVLAVGVGAPKQEKWIYKYKDKFTHVKIFMAVGATIDFEAGVIKRAPKWVSRLGMEWLFRIAADPKRLWKRYLVEDLPFFWLLMQQKFGIYTCPFSEMGSRTLPPPTLSIEVRKVKI